MEQDEYETAIGKLVILKLYVTKKHRDDIDVVIENLESEYLERKNRKEF